MKKQHSGRRHPKIMPEQALDIYDRYASGNYTMEDLARDYNVSRETISRILNQRSHGLAAVRPPLPKGYKRSRIGTAHISLGRRISNQIRYGRMTEETLERLVTIAYYLQLGYSHRRIAEAIGTSQPNVTVHIHRYPDEMALIDAHLTDWLVNPPSASKP